MINRLKRKVKQHIYKRHQRSEIRLSHNNIYILPSKDGGFFIAVALLNFVLGINYQNNLILAVSYIMAVMMIAALFLGFFNLNNTNVRYLGSNANFSPYSSSIRLSISSSAEIQSLRLSSEYNQTTTHISEVSDEKILELSAPELPRGVYDTGVIKILSYFPFGLIRTWSYIKPNDTFYVYPTPLPVVDTEFSFGSASNTSQSIQQKERSVEFDHLSQYQKGMSLSRVSWKHYAKTEQMLIKQNAPESADLHRIIFDYSKLSGSKEERLSKLCTMVLDADKQQTSYALLLQQNRIPFGQGETHKLCCLEALSEF
ncbi:DUF58 domain-containing protein [Pseudoalteromonas sp. M8]|nr:DUF58 domain-containing protein [Pseudoalteromonas sp. JC3]QUI70926.1 DUF58 domain-containing protein [Pseudoalteromonas sp. M8]